MSESIVASWQAICATKEISPFTGVRALFDGKQVAVFKLNDALYAIDAIDPFTGAAVLSRGIVGDIKGTPVVASPIYKQHFDLTSGVCLEDESVRVKTFPVREFNGQIELGCV